MKNSMKNKHNVRKNDKFLCINDVVMDDDTIAYRKGIVYKSEKNKCITDDDGDYLHSWKDCQGCGRWEDCEDNWGKYFKKISWIKYRYLKIKSYLCNVFQSVRERF
jgi:hypothetical protein